jgi:hypothetical protein
MDNAMTYLERWKECHKEGDRATAENIIENASNYDNVEHPLHYISKGGIETINVIDAWTEGLKGIEAVCAGNAIKYLSRWNKKNGVEDLKKARWYIDKLIELREKKS